MTESERQANIKDIVQRMKEIREGLEQTLLSLRARISWLETDRAVLLSEIERLKRAAETRVGALETEVGALKKEIKVLKEILGFAE